MHERITNPEKVSDSEINNILQDGKNPVIQFDSETYDSELLNNIDKLCQN